MLAAHGCDIVRVSVPSLDDIPAMAALRHETAGIPLVADVHYDHRIAVAVSPYVDKIRLNPGTLHGDNSVADVVAALKEYGIPLRIGANAGSLPPTLRKDPRPLAERLCDAAENLVERFAAHGFDDLVIAVKASDARETIDASRLAARRFGHPLHVGVTESGTAHGGTVRSAVALGVLLAEGVGDTIRVSLAADPLEEVRIGREILAALGLAAPMSRVIACPTCSRSRMDVVTMANRIEVWAESLPRPTRIAVMGCEVNGPGEAGDADWALVGTATGAALYRHGSLLARGSADELEVRLRTDLGKDPTG